MADTQRCNISVSCLGANPSGINNIKFKKSQTENLRHGDQLELLLGKFIYKVEFTPPPESIDEPKCEVLNKHNLKLFDNSKFENENYEVPVKKLKMSVNGDSVNDKNPTDHWEEVDSGKLLIFTKAGLCSRGKIAAYDLDGTIILTKSGKVFPENRDDWKIANPSVKSALTKRFEDDYKIVIFTNQAGISRGKTNVSDFKYKIEQIINNIGVPMQVFIATGDNIYRKPAPGMWDVLVDKKNSGLNIDIQQSFYVGDAAGRVVNWMPKIKKDFSSADRLFALNLELKFQTPESHFLNLPEGKYKLPEFQPSKLDANMPLSDGNITTDIKEVVIMVGSPGSGKSFFVETYLLPKGYSHINRDSLGSWQRCVSKMEEALNDGKSVVIDNTNPDKASRKRYLDVAAKMNVVCRCLIMNTTIEHAIHNNKFRQLVQDDHIMVNEMMIYSYRKKFEPPSKEEGFSEIVKINFVPKFNDPKRGRLYRMFLV